MIEAFGPRDSPARLADWVELLLVFERAAVVSDALVEGTAENVEDSPEHGDDDDRELFEGEGDTYDGEILEPAVERRREELWNEFEFRSQTLGNSYPFELLPTKYGGWTLRRSEQMTTETESRARAAYIAALVMSAFRNHMISRPDKKATDYAAYSKLVQRISELFQSLAVVAAGGLMRDVYWFGWPRNDASSFLKALDDVRNLIGLGTLRVPQSPTAVNMKDGTIDLIGWRTFSDRMYGALLFYGQVASGANWKSKPLRAHIDGKFLHHFLDTPGRHFIVSMFIPFVGHDEVTPVKGYSRDEVMADNACRIEKDYGIVVDRLRLTELIAEGAGDVGTFHNASDPSSVMTDLALWVSDCQNFVRAAS